MILKITEVIPMDGGSAVRLRLTISDGIHTENKALTLSDEQYFDCGRPKAGEISGELCEKLEALSAQHAAVRYGAYLLGYAPASRAALKRKLTSRGISPDDAGAAAQELAEHGYIDEEKQAVRLILRYANSNLYGRRRIEAELFHRGYARETVTAAFDACVDELDFDKNKKELIRRKFAGQVLSDPAVKQKVFALLRRYGY